MGYRSTDELMAVRFPNVDRDWLEMVNSTLGQMRLMCSGNALMCTTWNGGTEARTEWTFSIPKRPKYRKPPIQH